MTLNFEPIASQLDDTDWHILRILQENARIPFTELGRRVGMSSPAVAERVRRLEDAGVICGYRAEISLAGVGLPMQAIISLTAYAAQSNAAAEAVRKLPEVLECHKITGQSCFIMKVAVESVARLEQVIDHLYRYGDVSTSIILSSPVERRHIYPQPSPLDKE